MRTDEPNQFHLRYRWLFLTLDTIGSISIKYPGYTSMNQACCTLTTIQTVQQITNTHERGSLTTLWDVTRFPEHTWIRCVAPDCFIPPIWVGISTVVFRRLATTVGELIVRITRRFAVRRVGRPSLTRPSSHRLVDVPNVRSSWWSFSTHFTSETHLTGLTTVPTTGSSFVNNIEDTEDSKPKDGRRWSL